MKNSINLFLRTDLMSNDGTCRIDVRVYHAGKQYKFPTSKKIHPIYWDKSKQRVLNACKDSTLINKHLSQLTAKFDSYRAKKEALDEDLNIGDIRNLIRGDVKSTKIEKVLLSEIFDKYIHKLTIGTNRYNTIRNVKSTKKLTIEFAKSKYKCEPTIDLIKFSFLEHYKEFLKTERGNKDISINKRLRHLRTVVRYAIKLGYKVEYPFDGLKIEQGEPKCVYLTKVEYDSFKTINLGEKTPTQLKYTKDLFVFGCETGLRHGDIKSLTWENFDENLTLISKAQNKTGKIVNVPISAKAREIINKWSIRKENNVVFPYIPDPLVNRYLKVLAKRAKIEKHITFHVSRHTFASHLAMTLSPAYVMKLIGDKDMRMVNVYVNADKTDLIDAMEKHWNSVN